MPRPKPPSDRLRQVRIEIASLKRMKCQLVQQHINLHDVEFECVHGALPLDKVKPEGCLCWPPEAMAALRDRQQENPDYSDAA